MDSHGSLYQAVGRIEGTLGAFRAETRREFTAIGRQIDAGRIVHQNHDARLTALETAKAGPPPQADTRPLAAVAEILKAIAPAGGWFPWVLMALLAVTGILRPDDVKAWLHGYAMGSLPVASSPPAPG